MEFGHLEGLPRCQILRGRKRSPWLFSIYVRPGMILQVSENICHEKKPDGTRWEQQYLEKNLVGKNTEKLPGTKQGQGEQLFQVSCGYRGPARVWSIAIFSVAILGVKMLVVRFMGPEIPSCKM